MNYALSHLTLSSIHETLFNLCMSHYGMMCWVWMLLVLYVRHVFTGIEQNNTTKRRKKKNEKKRKVVATKIRSKYIHPPYFMDSKISVLEIVWRGGLQSYEAHTLPSAIYIYIYGIDCGKTQCPFALKFVRRETSVVVVVFTFQ